MMHGRLCNNLVVIENEQLQVFYMDDKLSWTVGRPSKNNIPDIKMYSTTVSRKHGSFQNMDGIWFYFDANSKNGTIYNGKKIEAGLNGRKNPIMISDGDTFIFGGGEQAVFNSKTVWAYYSTKKYSEQWQILDTKDRKEVVFTDGLNDIMLNCEKQGTVVHLSSGIAIYMGDVTYLNGNIYTKKEE